MSTTDQPNGAGTKRQSPEEIEADIELQREQLAGTIDALSAKLDVKSHAQAKVADVKTSVTSAATTDSGRPRPELVLAAVAVVVVVVGVVWWKRR